jgi:hypothetical protein
MISPELQATSNRMIEAVKGFVNRALATRTAELEARILALENRPQLRFVGTWDAHQQYNEAQTVTDRGSTWHCNRSTRARPGDASADWTLICKRGANGNDAGR